MSGKIKNSSYKNYIAPDILFLLIIAGVELFLFHHGVRWWYGDDPALLKIAVQHNFYDMFFSPASYREMTASNFTPLAFALFRLDYLVFGLSPVLFYFHMYAVVYLTTVLFYFSCRIRLSRTGSLAAVLIFMITMPFLESGSLLMQRHYTNGLFFAFCSFLFFDRYMESGRKYCLVATATFYFAASMCKEIFVPLPFVLVFFPYCRDGRSKTGGFGSGKCGDAYANGSLLKSQISGGGVCFRPINRFRTDIIFKRKLFAFILFLFFLFIYAVWRKIMLAGTGGYGLHIDLHKMLFMPLDLLTLIGGHGRLFYLSVCFMCVFFFIFAETEEKIFAIVLVFMSAAPVIPVISIMEIRYALLSALCVAVLSGWCVDTCLNNISYHYLRPERHLQSKGRRNLISGMFIMACAVPVIICAGSMLQNNINSWLPCFRQNRYKAMVEGSYLLEKGSNADFIKGVGNTPVFFSGLGWLRLHVLKLGYGPRPLFDWFQVIHRDGYRIIQYNRKTGCLTDVTDFRKDLNDFVKSLDMNKPLQMKLEYAEPVVKWEFGPWNNGQYTLFFENYYPAFIPLPGKGRFPLELDKNILVRLKFRSDKGWITYSPVKIFNLKNGKGVLVWSRFCGAGKS